MRARGSGGGTAHRWRALHLIGMCIAKAIGIAPRLYRFRLAMLFASAAGPLLRRTAAYRLQMRLGIDGPRELALFFVLQALTTHGVRYDPIMAVAGLDELDRAFASGRGVLLAGPHAALVLLLPRYFHDRGLETISVSVDAQMRLPGTRLLAKTVQPSPTFLLAVRTHLRSGRFVCALIDRGDQPDPRRTREFDTANGRMNFAPALLELAARCGAHVGFMEVHVGSAGLEGSIVMSGSESPEAVTNGFIQFVRGYVAARRNSIGGTES